MLTNVEQTECFSSHIALDIQQIARAPVHW